VLNPAGDGGQQHIGGESLMRPETPRMWLQIHLVTPVIAEGCTYRLDGPVTGRVSCSIRIRA